MGLFSKVTQFAESLVKADKSEKVKLTTESQATSLSRSTTIPELDKVVSSRGYKYYYEMLKDDQVKACILIKKLGVTVGGFNITPAVAESDPNYELAKEISDSIMYIFDKMEGSFSSMLLNIANGIVFGFSVNEIVFNLIEDESNPLFNGMVGIKNVKSKDIKTLFFDMDEFGTIKGLIQRVAGSETKVPLEKVILYTYDPYSTGFPQGVSDLAAAFRHYVSKEALMRYRNLAAEKFSAPTVIGKYPRNFTKAQQDELLAVCSRVAINGAGIIPDVASIELLESNTSVIMPYDTAIDSCNRGIARSIFGQILATDEGKDSGSFAQAKIHKGILGMYLDGLRFDIAEAVKEQVVRRLVKYNYNSSLVPNVELAPADRESIDIIANVMSAMISSGVVGKDEPFVREALGFPAKPEELMGDATIDSSSIPTVVAPIDGTQTQPVDDSNTQVEPDKGVTDAKDTKGSKTV